MLYNIYSMKDRVIAFNAPAIFIDDKVAMRAFKNYCRKSEIAEDLTLWKIGTFDDETGTIIGIMPEMVEMEETNV